MERALKFLPTYVAVLEAGGVRAAASLLHKTQSAISYDLAELQHIVGQQLLVRSGRTLKPTVAGHRVLEASKKILLDLRAALADQGVAKSPLRIAAVPGFGRYVAHALLLEHHPNRSIQLQFYSNEGVMERVRSGDAELGFCFAERASQTLAFEPFYREEMVLVTPIDRWRHPPAEDWRVVTEGKPAVGYDECDFSFATWFTNTTGDPRRSVLRGDHYLELEEVVRAVSAGRGYSILPRDTAMALAVVTPVAMFSAAPPVMNMIYLVYRSDRPQLRQMCPISQVTNS